MAETKEKGAEKDVVIINRGKRHFDLSKGRRLAPGGQMPVSEAEAKALLAYPDIAELAKLAVPENVKAMRAKNAKALEDLKKAEAENSELRKQLEERDAKDKKGGGK